MKNSDTNMTGVLVRKGIWGTRFRRMATGDMGEDSIYTPRRRTSGGAGPADNLK